MPGYNVIVIGGGPAGMMAAGRAAERGRKVLLLEKNEVLGKKLSVTGGGRCNITNAEEDRHALLRHYGSAEKFLYSSFTQFGVRQTFDFFEQRSLPLVVLANKRAFPGTEKASDVVQVMTRHVNDNHVEVRCGAEVGGFVHDAKTITGIRVGPDILKAESYILATGGASHQETGSTGDGFRWLHELGLEVHDPTPAVVPLAVRERWVKSLAGVALDDVKITFFVDGQKKFSKKGRILCTHFGISGPLILNLAKRVADLLYTGEVTATIDAFPSMDLGALDAHITSIFDQNKNRDVKNVMKVVAPTGTSAAILGLLPDIDLEGKVHSVSRDERKLIGRTFKSLPLKITGLMGLDRAVVVDGGVALSEIDGKTMRARSVPNLFVTGDLLHINRPSGGFSLQLCWTTGFVAGNHA